MGLVQIKISESIDYMVEECGHAKSKDAWSAFRNINPRRLCGNGSQKSITGNDQESRPHPDTQQEWRLEALDDAPVCIHVIIISALSTTCYKLSSVIGQVFHHHQFSDTIITNGLQTHLPLLQAPAIREQDLCQNR